MSDRCPCGCALVWDADEPRPHCPHCELPTLAQPDALLRALLDKVGG